MRDLAALALLLAAPAARGRALVEGRWVAVGPRPAPGLEWTARDDAFLAGTAAALAPCGFGAFDDRPDECEGPRRGSRVAVRGARPPRGEAAGGLAAVRPCVPDANPRRLRSFGG